MDKEAGRRWRGRVREVLKPRWKPIGAEGLPADEHGAHGGTVAAVLRDGPPGEEPPECLRRAETECLRRAETVRVDPPGDADRLGESAAAMRATGRP